MPLGIQQNNNFLHLTMDVWQDQIFFNETVYPAGHFAAELLNVPDETIRELVTHGGAISHQVEALALAGMEFVTAYDAFTKDAPRKESERIYVIAREHGKKQNN